MTVKNYYLDSTDMDLVNQYWEGQDSPSFVKIKTKHRTDYENLTKKPQLHRNTLRDLKRGFSNDQR